MERLHKFIASTGAASRRQAEVLIQEGRVSVNGEIIREMGVKVGEADRVELDGMVIKAAQLHYVLLNKPKGVVTTLSDPQRRPTIVRHLPDVGTPLKPVGRLDMDSSGLIFCTNDGELAQRMAHPRYGIEKEYRVIVRGEVGPKQSERLAKGIFIEDRKTAPAKVRIHRYEAKSDTTMFFITIHEGRNRQIRLMCEAIGCPVVELERIRIGFFTVKGIPVGQSRQITHQELVRLKELLGMGEKAKEAPKKSKPPRKRTVN